MSSQLGTESAQSTVRLNEHELRVLTLVTQGHSPQMVAEELGKSKLTVELHLASIYDKLKENNRPAPRPDEAPRKLPAPSATGHAGMKKKVRLTPPEMEVLSLIAQGHSSQEAALKLEKSKRTVDFHLANIYAKLEVNNRVQAFRAALRLGLIPFEPSFGFARGDS